jgi:hypothetical protein
MIYACPRCGHNRDVCDPLKVGLEPRKELVCIGPHPRNRIYEDSEDEQSRFYQNGNGRYYFFSRDGK